MRNYLPYIGILCLFLAGLIFIQTNQPRASFEKITEVRPSISPEVELFVTPDDWILYEDENFNYEIQFPKDFEVLENGENSIQIIKAQEPMGVGPTSFIYISVITPEKLLLDGVIYNYNPTYYKQLDHLLVSESVSLGDIADLSSYFTYRRYNDISIGTIVAKKYVNEKPWEFPSGTKETRLTFERDNRIFLIGGYTKSGGLSEFDLTEDLFEKVISTLKFPEL